MAAMNPREDGNTDYITRDDAPDGRVDNRVTNNRFIAAQSTEEEVGEQNPSRLLLNIMRDEYPDDPLYRVGRLTPGSQAQQALETLTVPEDTRKDMVMAQRNEKSIVIVPSEEEKYTSYELKKSVPTIDEEELDELIDEEWEEFEDPDDDGTPDIVPPGVSGLFLTAQEKDREDFHHLYLTRGPQEFMNDDNADWEGIFCVFYIHNSKARPIPNYKTLEVMLVERGLKYDTITEATKDQIKEYDLILDGQDTAEDFDKIENSDPGEEEEKGPIDEYIERAMADRSNEWDYHVRYRSGYRQLFPFRRDPGDYIKPESLREEGGRRPDLNIPEEEGPTPAQAGPNQQRNVERGAILDEMPGQDEDESPLPNSREERRRRRRERRQERRRRRRARRGIFGGQTDRSVQEEPLDPSVIETNQETGESEAPEATPRGDFQFRDNLLHKYDPEDRYFDIVFLRQTTREQMREKFEGNMCIARWPAPYLEIDPETGLPYEPPARASEQSDNKVLQGTPIKSDDWVLGARIMVMGHWKQVRSNPALRLYAIKRGVDMKEYEPDTPLVIGDEALTFEEAAEAGEGRYGPTGLIQLLVQGGAITVLEHEDDDPHPVWELFPHIVEAETDGIIGFDLAEYVEYLDYWSNGGLPFEQEHLGPYEPPGSVKYYDQDKFAVYAEQALMQEQIDAVKEQIQEIFPGISSEIEQTKIAFDSLPTNYVEYANGLLGEGGPLYRIMISRKGKWKYVKRKGRKKKKKTKTKVDEKNLFKCIKKAGRFRTRLKENEENDIVKKYKWMKTVARDKFASWANAGGGFDGQTQGVIEGPMAPQIQQAQAAADNAFMSAGMAPILLTTSFAATMALATPIGFAVGLAFVLIDALVGEVPDGKRKLPPWRFMKDNWYVKGCIYRETGDQISEFYQKAVTADTYMPWLREVIDQLHGEMFEIDEMMVRAGSLQDMQKALDFLKAMQELFRILRDGGLLDYVHGTRREIDDFLKDQLKRQYDAVQFIRKKCHKKVGNKKKFAIKWPKGPQEILNEYIPGLTYDNYMPF